MIARNTFSFFPILYEEYVLEEGGSFQSFLSYFCLRMGLVYKYDRNFGIIHILFEENGHRRKRQLTR